MSAGTPIFTGETVSVTGTTVVRVRHYAVTNTLTTDGHTVAEAAVSALLPAGYTVYSCVGTAVGSSLVAFNVVLEIHAANAVGTPTLVNQTDGFANGKGTIIRNYQVVNSNLADGPVTAKMAVAALPSPYGYYLAQCQATHLEKYPLVFQIDATYETPNAGQNDPSPLARPSILNSSYQEFMKPYFIDMEDPPPEKCITSVGTALDPMPVRDASKLVLHLTKNLPTYPTVTYETIKHTTNADTVTLAGTTYDANALLLLPVMVQEIYELIGTVRYHYFQTTFRMRVDGVDAHLDKFEDRSLKMLDTTTGKLKPIMYNGAPVDFPYPLVGGVPASSPSDTPDEIVRMPYASVSWGLDFS